MKYISLVIALLVIGFFVGRYFYHQPEFVVGAKAPNFEAELINFRPFELYDFAKDKVVLVEFWGSWCIPCRAKNKKLVKVYNEYKGREFEGFDDFDIVSIGLDEIEDNWKNAIMADRLEWQYHIYEQDMFKSELAKLYGITEIPSNYLVNSEGTIIGVNMTADNLKKYLIDHLKKGN